MEMMTDKENLSIRKEKLVQMLLRNTNAKWMALELNLCLADEKLESNNFKNRMATPLQEMKVNKCQKQINYFYLSLKTNKGLRYLTYINICLICD
jgi:hypothetical protein